MKIIIFLFTVLWIAPVFGSEPEEEPVREDSIQPRIDSHIHLYDTRREGSSIFLDPVVHEKIYFPHFAKQFVDTASPAGIGYAVVVEASQRREDNFWLMQHVDTSDALLAFIANLDPRDPNFVADLDALSAYEKFKGIRIRPVTPINIGDVAIYEKFAHLADRSLVLELGGNGVDPAVVAFIARRYPHMNIIMNHLAGGRKEGDRVLPGDWEDRLQVFASESNVYCKISALYTLSGQVPAPVEASAYNELIDPVLDAFGAERVFFGSNWTLSDMLGSYDDMILMLDDYCESRTDLTPEQLFFENANRAYGITQESVGHVEKSALSICEKMKLYPNPANERIIVSSNYRPMERVRIMDLRGRLVHQQVVDTRNLELDVSDWSCGIYFVQIIHENDVDVQRFLIQ